MAGVSGPWTRLLGLAAIVVLVTYALVVAVPRTTHGFVAYYTAARLLLAGDLDARVYDDRWFGAQVRQQSQSTVVEIFGPNPPSMALAAAPLAAFDHHTARTIWIFGSLALLAIGAWSLLRLIDGGNARRAFLIGVLALTPSVFANILDGQIYLALFALFVAVSLALLKKHDVIAGTLLGIALAIKTSGAPLLVFLIVLRRWRAAGAAVITVGALAGAVWIKSGSAIWYRYPPYVAQFIARPASTVTAYQTTRGFLRHVCPECAPVSADAVILGIVVLTGVLIWKRHVLDELALAGTLTLSILILPIAEDTHFVLLGVPLALWMSVENVSQAMLLTVGVLLLVPPAWTIHAFTTGWSSLLAYPRLYAAWLLWFGINAQAMRSAIVSARGVSR
jgi:hypothetical protein